MTMTDELLCAYLDGELGSEQARAVEDAVRADSTLAARLDELRAVDALLRANAQAIDELPLPASLDAVFAQSLANAASATTPVHDNVVPLTSRWRRIVQDRRFALPLAASIALIAGYAGMFLTGPDQKPAPAATLLADGRPIDGALQDVLDWEESGSVRRTADQREVEIRLSFAAKDNSLCREFTVRLPDRGQDAVACRSAGTQWELRHAAASGKAAADAEGYQAASSTDSEAFGMAVEAMMAGDALTADQEREWIRRGWTP